MFGKAQIMEFKDAFSIMDTNGDSIVDMNDLKVTFDRLGKITSNRVKKKLTYHKKDNLQQRKRSKQC